MADRYSLTDEFEIEESPGQQDSETNHDGSYLIPSPPRGLYDDSRSIGLSLVLNSACAIFYGYAIYFANYDPKASQINNMLDPSLRPFGLWKFLTYYSLIMQFVSAILHLICIIVLKYRPIRDIFFTSLAYPVGCFVEFSFWIVWWTQGRDLIYPKLLESYYPIWLNHVTHTMSVPVNIAQIYLTYHRFYKGGSFISLGFMTVYCLFCGYIRLKSGNFVYPFMNQMGITSVLIYFSSILFCTTAFYETCYFLTAVLHLKKIRRLTE